MTERVARRTGSAVVALLAVVGALLGGGGTASWVALGAVVVGSVVLAFLRGAALLALQ